MYNKKIKKGIEIDKKNMNNIYNTIRLDPTLTIIMLD